MAAKERKDKVKMREKLALKALDKAREMGAGDFARDGEVDFCALIEADEGTFRIVARLGDDDDQDAIALIVRYQAAACDAKRVTLFSEGWVGSPGWKSAPSADPNCEEILWVRTETDKDFAEGRAPLHRSADLDIGPFSNAQFIEKPPQWTSRFQGLMPSATGISRADGQDFMSASHSPIDSDADALDRGDAGSTIH